MEKTKIINELNSIIINITGKDLLKSNNAEKNFFGTELNMQSYQIAYFLVLCWKKYQISEVFFKKLKLENMNLKGISKLILETCE